MTPLDAELDAWARAGLTATLWWRDDDAAEPGPGLDHLLALAAEAEVPVALAVIPARAADGLAALVERCEGTSVLQHGYAHANHAPEGAGRASELGSHRPAEAVLGELADGQARLRDLFGTRFRPVLVPPWNRVDEGLVPRLGEAGFVGLSTFGARPARAPAPGLVQVNAHCDIIKWREGRRFVGAEKTVGMLVEHLRERREGGADIDEPTGLLTHHWAHDEAAWDVLATLVGHLAAHPAARWPNVGASFPSSEAFP